MFRKFWQWYDRNEQLSIGVAAGLFSLQLIHLYWLTAHVVFEKAFGVSGFNPSRFVEIFIWIVDYTEIPALLTTSLVYVNDLRKKFSWKAVLFLIFLNSQWLHIFWITDEVVVEQFTGSALVTLPIWFSWGAILIDYLELPVIYDTMKRFLTSLKKSGIKNALGELKEE